MKIKKLFKQKEKTVKNVDVQTLDKKQLAKVAGGAEEASVERWQAQGIGHTSNVK